MVLSSVGSEYIVALMRSATPLWVEVDAEPRTTVTTTATQSGHMPLAVGNETHRNEKEQVGGDAGLILYVGAGIVCGGVVGLILLKLLQLCLRHCTCPPLLRRHVSHIGAQYDGNDSNLSVQHDVKVLLASIPVQSYKRLTSPSQKRWTEEDPCAICLDDLRTTKRARQLPCGHIFHSQCVDPWVLHRLTCPLCVASVLSDDLGDEIGFETAALLRLESF